MNFFNTAFAICTAAAILVPAAFAQDPGESAAARGNGLQRAADLVNLMRTVFDPNPAPVLVSPAERAVAAKTTDDPAAPVVKTVPVVVMPDIVLPESEANADANAGSDTDADSPPRTAAASAPAGEAVAAKTMDDPDSAEYPPFSYAFFFGEYVPYYQGWFYYSDRWLWGRRGVIPLEPPGWIPPPPPPFDPFRPDIGPGPGPRPGKTGRASASAQQVVRPNGQNSTIPVVPDRHRVPRANDARVEAPAKNSTIPVVPDLHRIPRANDARVEAPAKNSAIPVSPTMHRIPSKAASQNLFPQKDTTIPVSPGAHRIPRKSDL